MAAAQPEAVQVRRFQLEGNTLVSESELAPVLAPYQGRRLTLAEIKEAAEAVTQYHISRLASVVNQGELRVAEGGSLLLVAPMVDNQGVIVARAGQVGLVGSSDATINFDGQGLVEIRVPQAQISNLGTVALDPQAVSEVLRQVVADPEIVEAGQLPRGEGLVIQEGRIEAERVVLNSTRATLVAPGSFASGQDVRVLSSGLSRMDGNVRGDFVELSGRHVGLSGSLTANQFLLDPDTIHITDSNAPAPLDTYLPNVLLANDAAPNEISRGALEALPAGLHLYCPGLFNASWLYVNGKLTAHCPQKELWWLNDYSLSWDAPLQGLQPGANWLVLRTKIPLHLAGLFRPPFLYKP